MCDDVNRGIKRAPTALGPHGRELWRSVLTKYSLTPTEVEVLETLCVTSDQLHRIDLALKQSKVVSTGSQGQLVGHPLLAEHRAHTDMVRRLANQLKLPDAVAPQRKPKMNPGRVSRLHQKGSA
jgi:phage terminase small subunit